MKRLSLFALGALALCLSAGRPALATPPDRPYFIDETKLPFPALPGTTSDRFWGIVPGGLAGAAYQIEVPAGWNGELVLYAHGYRGTGAELTVTMPPLREYLIKNGYAWAASSYSTNFYDVRQGVLDTHALGGVFQEQTGRTPSRTYVTGHSMGGHITSALIERYPDEYVGALPMCGVMGEQRSGGTRPAFKETFEYWNSGPGRKNFLFVRFDGSDGTVNGIASSNVTTNLFTEYRFGNGDDDLTPAEQALNRDILRVAPTSARFEHGADGLQNIVPVHAAFRIPVLSLHTIGDLFVPLSMEQIYARRAHENGAADLLVQRAYRDPNHCGFAPQEEARAFADLVNWVEKGEKPRGDELLDPEGVADPQFGCRFTAATRAPYPACAPAEPE